MKQCHSDLLPEENLGKWLSPKYGVSNLMKTLLLMPWESFSGIYDHHMPQPYLKSHYQCAWKVWGEQLDKSCRNQFRNLTDLSHWLIRYNAICQGKFKPRSMGDCSLMTIEESTIDDICGAIVGQQYRMICMNDSTQIENFELLSERLCGAFNVILPDKSSYEI